MRSPIYYFVKLAVTTCFRFSVAYIWYFLRIIIILIITHFLCKQRFIIICWLTEACTRGACGVSRFASIALGLLRDRIVCGRSAVNIIDWRHTHTQHCHNLIINAIGPLLSIIIALTGTRSTMNECLALKQQSTLLENQRVKEKNKSKVI